MRIPLSWLREYVDVPAADPVETIAEHLVRAGLEVEEILTVGDGLTGPLVVGRVLEVTELTEFKKPIRFCRVEVGEGNGHADTPGERGIICGASNFAAGDLVVVALPGAVLPGGFAIASRETYGRVSDGMICSERELALGHDHAGIMVLPPGTAAPGASAREVLGIGEQVIDVTVTPDIGYCLSLRGIARELATAYGLPLRDPGLEVAALPAPSGATPAQCVVDDLDGAALYTLSTITGFDPRAATPQWLRARLNAAGVRPVSLAVDVTNYVMVEVGQPLHAFDLGKLTGPVSVRRARSGETLETLDHVRRTLSTEDLVIADDRGAIGLAGVMGGLHSEIDDATTDIALEAAWFAPAGIARTARRHKLSSDASRRYERGVDRVLAPYAGARAAALLLELGGGSYVGMTAVEAPYVARQVSLDVELPQRIAGIEVPTDEVVSRLQAVGCRVAGGHILSVTPPSWRPDLTDPYDLVEEVLRLGGYDAIPAAVPRAPLGRGLTREQRQRRQVSRAVAASAAPRCCRSRSSAWPSSTRSGCRPTTRAGGRCGWPTRSRTRHRGCVRRCCRGCWRRFAATSVAARATSRCTRPARCSCRRGQPERGVTIRRDRRCRPAGRRGPRRAGRAAARPAVAPRHRAHRRCVRLPAGGARARRRAGPTPSSRHGWWPRAVGVTLDRPGRRRPTPWHPGRCAELVVDGAVVGHAGELHPRAVAAFGLPARTAAMELDLDAVLAAGTAVGSRLAVSATRWPRRTSRWSSTTAVPAADVEAALRDGAGELLESVRLFDVYTGEQVGAGSKSLAYALRFRAPDRTLTDDEVSAARDAAVAAAAATVGATLRG